MSKKTNKRTPTLFRRSPELNGVAGWSLAAFLAVLAIKPDPQNADLATFTIWFGLATGLGLLGAAFFYKGLSRRTPIVVDEQAWNERYDKLRNETDRFMEESGSQWSNFRGAHGQLPLPDLWPQYARGLPIPRVESGPLHEWANTLKAHSSQEVRLFFEFTSALTERSFPNEYRRLAVRTYDWLYRARASLTGFPEWMEAEEVSAGAEDLMVILAYMEVARAKNHPVGKTATHLGFWLLAEEWHPNTVEKLST
jgi:hypothetical protein